MCLLRAEAGAGDMRIGRALVREDAAFCDRGLLIPFVGRIRRSALGSLGKCGVQRAQPDSGLSGTNGRNRVVVVS